MMNYIGYAGSFIPSISSRDVSRDEFFSKFIAKRTPVHFTDQLSDDQWSGAYNWINDSYLRKHCGECQVRVEVKGTLDADLELVEQPSKRRTKKGDSGAEAQETLAATDSVDNDMHQCTLAFGQGRERVMQFNDFLDQLGDESLYLTTQELEYSDVDGAPTIISPPVNKLQHDFPLVPALFGNLVIANINMWFGHVRSGFTSSGLHHDYHDNLYLLLRGCKIITLYSPAEAMNLYTVGEIAVVHCNGRINYSGQQPTRADGADLLADNALQAAAAVQKAAEELHRRGNSSTSTTATAVGSSSSSSSSSFVAAAKLKNDALLLSAESEEEEDELDRALEAALDVEMADQLHSESGSDSEEENDSSNDDNGVDDGSDEWEHVGNRISSADARVTASTAADGKGVKRKHIEANTAVKDLNSTTATKSKPDNFSRVNSLLPDEQLQAQFPRFVEMRSRLAAEQAPKAEQFNSNSINSNSINSNNNNNSNSGKSVAMVPCGRVVLNAGEMLYIPAGWFHEVHSSSNSSGISSGNNRSNSISSSSGSIGSGEAPIGHMAFNYWFHPPDNDDFHHPYKSDFWRQDFEERKRTGYF